MSRLKTICQISCIAGAVVVGVPALILLHEQYLTDPNGKPTCHKLLMLDLYRWQDTNHTSLFPNIDGLSVDSLSNLRDDADSDTIVEMNEKYMYVPGLKSDDPGELVLMYMREPTRWTWHGWRPSVFRSKAWNPRAGRLCVGPSRTNSSARRKRGTCLFRRTKTPTPGDARFPQGTRPSTLGSGCERAHAVFGARSRRVLIFKCKIDITVWMGSEFQASPMCFWLATTY